MGPAAAAAAILAIFLVTGFPPTIDNIQATIGHAKRYNAPQMTEGDARIGDPAVQTFLQSETFAALLADPDAMKLLANPEIRAALANQTLVAELSRAELSAELAAMEANGSLRYMLNHAELLAELKNEQLVRWLTNDAIRAEPHGRMSVPSSWRATPTYGP